MGWKEKTVRRLLAEENSCRIGKLKTRNKGKGHSSSMYRQTKKTNSSRGIRGGVRGEEWKEETGEEAIIGKMVEVE